MGLQFPEKGCNGKTPSSDLRLQMPTQIRVGHLDYTIEDWKPSEAYVNSRFGECDRHWAGMAPEIRTRQQPRSRSLEVEFNGLEHAEEPSLKTASRAVANTSNLKPFQKGQSGNPGGRPKGIAAKAREHTDRALEVLVEALDDEDTRVRITAAKEIIDRGFGKPLTMTADVTNKIEDFDDESLDAAISVLKSALGTSDEPGDGEAAQTAH